MLSKDELYNQLLSFTQRDMTIVMEHTALAYAKQKHNAASKDEVVSAKAQGIQVGIHASMLVMAQYAHLSEEVVTSILTKALITEQENGNQQNTTG